MAYVFNKIGDQLAGNQQSVFQEGNVQKASAGSVTPSGGGGELQQQAKASQVNMPSSALMQSARESYKPPAFLGQIGQEQAAAESNLYGSADQFRKNLVTLGKQSLSEGELNMIEAGNAGATKKAESIINPSPVNIPTFNAPDVSSKTLAQTGDLKKLVMGQDPGITSGMGRFTSSALRSTPAYRNTIEALTANEKRIADAIPGLQKSLSDFGEYRVGRNIESSREQAINQLKNREQKIKDEQIKQAEDFTKASKTAAQNAAGNLLYKNIAENVGPTSTARPQYDTTQYTSGAIREAAKTIDPTKYATTYTPEQMWSPEEQARFNRITALLGSGAVAPTGYIGDIQNPAGFDRDRYWKDVLAATAKTKPTTRDTIDLTGAFQGGGGPGKDMPIMFKKPVQPTGLEITGSYNIDQPTTEEQFFPTGYIEGGQSGNLSEYGLPGAGTASGQGPTPQPEYVPSQTSYQEAQGPAGPVTGYDTGYDQDTGAPPGQGPVGGGVLAGLGDLGSRGYKQIEKILKGNFKGTWV